MSAVETVRGPIETDALGPTLMHEHVFVLSAEILQNKPELWDEEERVADAIAKLDALAARGVDSIVDPTVVGLGRYIPRIQRVAEQTTLNIVVATGLYTYDDTPFHYHYRFDPRALVDDFVKDITEGIAGTGVKAGIIKCATDRQGVTP